MSKFFKKIFFLSAALVCGCTSRTIEPLQYNYKEPLFICTDKTFGDLRRLRINLTYGSDVSYNKMSEVLFFSLVGTITNSSEETLVIPNAYSQISSLLLTDEGCIEGSYTTDIFLDDSWRENLRIEEDGIAWRPFTCKRKKKPRGILIEGGQSMRFKSFLRVEGVKIRKDSSILKVKIIDPNGRFKSNEIEFFIWDSWKM